MNTINLTDEQIEILRECIGVAWDLADTDLADTNSETEQDMLHDKMDALTDLDVIIQTAAESL